MKKSALHENLEGLRRCFRALEEQTESYGPDDTILYDERCFLPLIRAIGDLLVSLGTAMVPDMISAGGTGHFKALRD